MTLGEQIAELRKARKMSQEELANAMQVSRQAVSKWENGLSYPDTENLIRLAEIFDMDVNVLVCNQLSHECQTETSAQSKEKNNSYTHTVRLLSILLALSLCTTILFAGLWLSEKQDQNTVCPDETRWDSVKMYNGLLREEVPLSLEDQALLENLLWNYHYTAKAEADTDDDIVCGGICVDVEFIQNNVTYIWSFSPKTINFTVKFADGNTIGHAYEADKQIFQLLNALTERERNS